jgi:hypothetical protein
MPRLPLAAMAASRGQVYILRQNGSVQTFNHLDYAPSVNHSNLSDLIGADSAVLKRDGCKEATDQTQRVPAKEPRQLAVSAAGTIVVDMSHDPDDPPTDDKAETSKQHKSPSLFLTEFFLLALNPKKVVGSFFEIVPRDIKEKLPFLLETNPNNLTYRDLNAFCQYIHSIMMEAWGPITTVLTQ